MRGPHVVVTALAIAIALSTLLLQERQRPASLSVTGELVAYEASRQDLTVRTSDGDRHFVVRHDTPVYDGARPIALDQLRSAGGCPTKVWYRDAQGRSMASQIRISCPPA